MATPQRSSQFATAMPRWQTLAALIGFPAIYLANSFTLWSMGLFVAGDRAWYLPFWTSVLVLHWLSAAVIAFVWRAGGRLSDIGLPMSPTRLALFLGLIVAVGVGLLALRRSWPQEGGPDHDWQIFYPATMMERVFWIALCFTAGFCEELIYRGFAIRTLQERGWRTWQATVLATISFAFIHGTAGVFLFPFYFVAGLIFAGVFLWRKSLWPAMCLHGLYNLGGLVAI